MMTPQLIIAIGIRLAALLLLIGGIGNLFSTISVGAMSDEPFRNSLELTWHSLSMYTLSATKLIAAILFWVYAMTIADRIIPIQSQSKIRPGFSASDAIQVGCSLIGLWLFVMKLPVVAWYL